MAPRSSISRDPTIQLAVEKLIAEGATIDEISEAVAEYGISRSAVGRYAKRYRPMVEGIQRDRALREALKKHLPDGVDTQLVDLAFFRAQGEVLRTIDSLGEEEDAASPKDLAATMRALRALVDGMRSKKAFEDEVRAAERKRIAAQVEQEARRNGASEALIQTIRDDILMGRN